MHCFANTVTVTALGLSRCRAGKEKGRASMTETPGPVALAKQGGTQIPHCAKNATPKFVSVVVPGSEKSRNVRGGTFPERVSDAPTRRE